MPKRKTYRGRRSRKPYGKRRRRPVRRIIYSRKDRGKFLPTKKLVTHKYAEAFDLNPGVNTPSVYTFSANGMYDPNISGIGHQPYFFDQCTPLWDHYTVILASIKVTVVSADATAATGAYRWGIATRDVPGQGVPPETATEQPRVITKIVGPLSSNNMSTITMRCAPGKFLARSHPLSDSDLKGSVVSNPAEQVYFNIWAAGIDAAADPPALKANVLITYKAVWTEPKLINGS